MPRAPSALNSGGNGHFPGDSYAIDLSDKSPRGRHSWVNRAKQRSDHRFPAREQVKRALNWAVGRDAPALIEVTADRSSEVSSWKFLIPVSY